MAEIFDWDEIERYKIVLMCGLPGSGKSYWAKKIAEKMSAKHFSSDYYRKKMFKSVRLSLDGDDLVGIYSRKAYEEMYKDVIKWLKDGGRVVVDATHLKKGRSLKIEEIKEVTDRIVIVVVKAKRAVMDARMSKKRGKANEKESFYEAWKRVVGYFDGHLEKGNYSWPSETKDAVRVVEIENN